MALLHVTSRRAAAKSDRVPAKIRRMAPAERLRSILEQRQLRPCSTYYSEDQPVVCFTEGDEAYLAELVTEKGHEPWGVVLDHDALKHRGVKPIRYLHESDVTPADDPWRNVRYDHSRGLDWYWEREWRWRGDEPLELQPDDILAVVVADPQWPGPVTVAEYQPDDDVLPTPAVPDWIEGVERFLWVPEHRQFVKIGPYQVPPWKRVAVSMGRTIPYGGAQMYASVGASSVVFTDEQNPQEVYQRLLATVSETLDAWLANHGR